MGLHPTWSVRSAWVHRCCWVMTADVLTIRRSLEKRWSVSEVIFLELQMVPCPLEDIFLYWTYSMRFSINFWFLCMSWNIWHWRFVQKVIKIILNLWHANVSRGWIKETITYMEGSRVLSSLGSWIYSSTAHSDPRSRRVLTPQSKCTSCVKIRIFLLPRVDSTWSIYWSKNLLSSWR